MWSGLTTPQVVWPRKRCSARLQTSQLRAQQRESTHFVPCCPALGFSTEGWGLGSVPRWHQRKAGPDRRMRVRAHHCAFHAKYHLTLWPKCEQVFRPLRLSRGRSVRLRCCLFASSRVCNRDLVSFYPHEVLTIRAVRLCLNCLTGLSVFMLYIVRG